MKTINLLLPLALMIALISCDIEIGEISDPDEQNQEQMGEGTIEVDGTSLLLDYAYSYSYSQDRFDITLLNVEYDSIDTAYDNEELILVEIDMLGLSPEGEFTGSQINYCYLSYFENGMEKEIILDVDDGNLSSESSVSITKNGDVSTIIFDMKSTDGQTDLQGSFSGPLVELCGGFHTQTGSALDFSSLCNNLFDYMWNTHYTSIPSVRDLSTDPNTGIPYEFGGKYVAPFYFLGDNSDYITTNTSRTVNVEGPEGSIIEIFDLETLTVISSNNDTPGSVVSFSAEPNKRYGGFAWYSDNSQQDLDITTSFD